MDNHQEAYAALIAGQAALNIDDTQLAKRLGVSKSTVCLIKKGKRRVGFKVRVGASRLFDDQKDIFLPQ